MATKKLTEEEKYVLKELKNAKKFTDNVLKSAVNNIDWHPSNPTRQIVSTLNKKGIKPALVTTFKQHYDLELTQEDVEYMDNLAGYNSLVNPDAKWAYVHIEYDVYYVMDEHEKIKAYTPDKLPSWIAESVGMLKLMDVSTAISHVGYRITENNFYVLHRPDRTYEDGVKNLASKT